jgi:thioredoxin reductase
MAEAEREPAKPFDCIILGGGPAGLAAGVYLGRYLRSTLILDHKKPQTRWHRPIAHNVLGFPSGIHRNQLLDWGRAHVAKYECVQMKRTTVVRIAQEAGGEEPPFVLTDDEGEVYRSRAVILATGIEYLLPEIPEILTFAGHSVWHCPECDGYKCLGKKIVVIGNDAGSAEMALNVSIWADEVTLCMNGKEPEMDGEARGKLKAANIRVVKGKVRRIVGDGSEGAEGMLVGLEVEKESGGVEVIAAYGAFANEGCTVPDELLGQLPLELHKGRWVKVDHRMRTNIPRCYAAGDIVANAQTQLSVAMGTGATAAIWLHKELLPAGLCLSGREW